MQICFAFQNNFNSNYISLTQATTYSLSKHLLSTQKSTTKYLAYIRSVQTFYNSTQAIICYVIIAYDDDNDDYDWTTNIVWHEHWSMSSSNKSDK